MSTPQDAKLKAAVEEHGTTNGAWRKVSGAMGINETQCKSHWHRIGRYDREIKLIRSVWADEDVSLFAIFVVILEALSSCFK